MRKRTAVIAAVAIVAVGGGIAYAAWSSTGSGNGSVTSTREISSNITPVSGAGLYPGKTVSFVVEIDNPNGYAVQVTSISAGSSEQTSGGCVAGTVTSMASGANPGGVIAAGQKASYTLQATMNKDAADNCKSQTFTLPLTATLVSAA
ncbi:hypothetical protein [Lentzea sp. NPDC059081]|uniref:hypothetical protein n=1 Tax=Lentzea sp. NPDC059081 TaxID=3346719 RepID=UPI003677C8F8